MSDRAPLWLQSAEVLQLLNLLVDRLDNADLRGTRVQSIALNSKTWPALYEAAFESQKEDLWDQLGDLVRWGWMSIKPAGISTIRSGYDQSPRLTILDEQALRATLGRPERKRSAAERWRDAVIAGLAGSDEVKRQVSEYCIDIPGRTMPEVVERLNELPALIGKPLLLRELSAQLFWGMSKVLDKRQSMVAAILQLDECPFPESPVQLQVFLPRGGFWGVLFVENLTTYDRCLRSESLAVDGLALVFASGFKGSAQRLRTVDGCSLFFSDRGDNTQDIRDGFKAWLFGSAIHPVFFWGDLDWAGMRILATIRVSFPGLTAWQPGYRPMLLSLKEGHGHPPEAADKQGQKVLASSGCAFADCELVPALRETGRFIDQELFRP